MSDVNSEVIVDWSKETFVIKRNLDNSFTSDKVSFDHFNGLSYQITCYDQTGLNVVGLLSNVERVVTFTPIYRFKNIFPSYLGDLTIKFMETEVTAFNGATSTVWVPVIEELRVQ